jgi:mono/diheme cytochrome c family protein
MTTVLVAITGFSRPIAPRFEKTTWDSVYTTAQATRGESLYTRSCARCHKANLAGGDDGSPLAGHEFMNSWNGSTLDGLFKKIWETMPSDSAPKTLPPKDVADITAYLLSKNQFPAGAAALSDNPDQLREIKFAATHP